MAVLMLVPASVAAQEPSADPQPACRDATPRPVDGASRPGDGAPDPAGRIAYTVVGRHDPLIGPIGAQIYGIDPDGSDHVLLLDCDAIRPQWSPDGRRLAFTIGMDDGSWQMATIAADSSDLAVLTSGPGIREIPTWAPDGSWLACDHSPIGDPEDPAFFTTLWRVDADGSGASLLGAADTFDTEPRISPDGSEIAFKRWYPMRDWAGQIVVRDLSTGAERAVTPTELSVEHPEWSPDGRSLVVNGSDDAPNAGTVYRIDLDHAVAAPAVILDPGSGWGGVKPIFAPDGSRVALICHAAGERDDGHCLMAPDGTGIKALVEDPAANENHAAWGVTPR